jgi:hypothetical protein
MALSRVGGKQEGMGVWGERSAEVDAGRVGRAERGRGGAVVLAWRVQRGNVGVDGRGWCGERAVVEQAGRADTGSGTSGGKRAPG